ncbi:MAG: SxtJ family membrane protein [Alphaproteobacteria bacterium]
MTVSSPIEPPGQRPAARIGADRSFGLVFACVSLLPALAPLWKGEPPRLWAVALATGFLAVALVRPAWLGPMNRVWYQFGLLLHRGVSPVVMGLIFFGALSPLALLLRWLGKVPLRLELEPEVASYWIARPSPSPAPGSMKRQF